MVTAVALGIVAGLSVTLLAAQLWPARRLDLPEQAFPGGFGKIEQDQDGRPHSNIRSHRVGPMAPIGESALAAVVRKTLAVSGIRYPSGVGTWAGRHGAGIRVNQQDLAISSYDHDNVLSAKILAAVVTGLTSLAVGAVLDRAVGNALPGLAVVLLAVLLAVAAYLVPDAVVRRQARALRGEFEQALPVWCDLVALEMAGAAAPQEALVSAAGAGTTWPTQVLRDTLYRATRAHQGHWQALTELGLRIGVDDLAQLGRLSQLVSHEGAEVRDTLIERAEGMRRRALSSELGQAGERDESMRLAVLIIAAGVVLLLLYPGTIAVVSL